MDDKINKNELTSLSSNKNNNNNHKGISLEKCQTKVKYCNLPVLIKKKFRVKNRLAREFLAEMFGTFILISFGCGSAAQNILYSKDNPLFSSLFSINASFGFAAALAVVVVGKISGAHINPAVSFAMLLTGRLTLSAFFVYTIAQFIGAFVGSLFVYVNYLDGIYKYQSELTLDTAGIFATYPNKNLGVLEGFFDQVFGTFMLVSVVLALNDKKNASIPHGTLVVIVGFLVTLIGCSFSYNAGGAVNPARDFGPRIFSFLIWGPMTFTAGNYFFWIPIVGPMVGSLIATIVYSIIMFTDDDDESREDNNCEAVHN